jgi:hypothetical protein
VALCLKRMPNYALDNADIVREAMLRQIESYGVISQTTPQPVIPPTLQAPSPPLTVVP